MTDNSKKDPNRAAITSPDMNAERLQELKRLFPDLFNGEGQLDEDALRAVVSPQEGSGIERFCFEWPGKHESKRRAFTASRATLIADKKRSMHFDDTQNTIIEGDNLEALKSLRLTYSGKVKCIYIDPPYNTTSDFIYPDDYTEGKKAYWRKNGTVKNGVKLISNPETSGRRHSNWLNMMQPRLLLARQFLDDDGVIYISIDDNEQANLKKMCDDIFGEENYIGMFPWRKRTAKSDVPFGISQDYEWIIGYAKNNFLAGIPVERKYHKTPDHDSRWRLSDLTKQSSKDERPNSFFVMRNPRNGLEYPANSKRVWAVSEETFQSYYDKGKIVFPGDYSFLNISSPAYRVFEDEDIAKNVKKFGTDNPLRAISTHFTAKIGMTEDGTKEIDSIFNSKIFPFPKPSSLIHFLINAINDSDALFLDFFAGSGTTAHAIMQKNAEDNGNRKYILVQVPEYTDEKSEAYKAGYKTISDICIERVKRAGEKIKSEHPDAKTDTGFRVYRLSDSHFSENLFTSDPKKTADENRTALQAHLQASASRGLFPADNIADVITELSLNNGYGLFFDLEPLKELFPHNMVYRLCGNDKSTLLCLDDVIKQETLDTLIEGHADDRLIIAKIGLDTAATWTLQQAFKDNMQII